MLALFLTVAAVHLVALMSPGPDFFCLANRRQPLTQRGDDGGAGHHAGDSHLGRRGADGTAPYSAKMAWLHEVIMVCGGLYLTGWAGSCCGPRIASIVSRWKMPSRKSRWRKGHSFLKGFLTNLSNPKAVIYFGSVFHCLSATTSQPARAGGFCADHQ